MSAAFGSRLGFGPPSDAYQEFLQVLSSLGPDDCRDILFNCHGVKAEGPESILDMVAARRVMSSELLFTGERARLSDGEDPQTPAGGTRQIHVPTHRCTLLTR